jgi:tetratricopeptide (TPR) repeat protein
MIKSWQPRLHCVMQYWIISGILVLLVLGLRGNVLVSKILSNRGVFYLLQSEIKGDGATSSGVIKSNRDVQLSLSFSDKNSSAIRLAGFLSWFKEFDPEKLISLYERGVLDPMVALKAGFTLLSQGKDSETVMLWNAVGIRDYLATIQSKVLIPYDTHDSSTSCTLSAIDSGGSGDIWYYLGLIYETRGLYEQAISAYRQAGVSDGLSCATRSTLYYRIGVIYQWDMLPPKLEEAKAAYKTALDENDFASCAEAADAFYKHGEVEWWLQSDPADYVVDFQRAVALNPNHASAHLQLGIAYYALYKDVKMAEAEIHKSIELSPNNPWAYYWLADTYQKAGDVKEAIKLYQQALSIAPTFKGAEIRLNSLK